MTLLATLAFLSILSVGFTWTDLKNPNSPGFGLYPGPLVSATQGEVWPKPQEITVFDQTVVVNTKNFTFSVDGTPCDIVTETIKRYEDELRKTRQIIRKMRKASHVWKHRKFNFLNELRVNLSGSCERYPHFPMNEQYRLLINTPELPERAELHSESAWGILRGLETFLQLTFLSEEGTQLYIRSVNINDYPRFPHRGLHLDTARHYMPMKIIKAILDGMAINKMNVFHWHLVDDQSFPYESRAWPQLSVQGAYSPLHVYTQSDVADVIEYARMRGIRVMPEFDTPGHTRSWGNAYPELLTKCYDFMGQPDGSLGPMNPISNFTEFFMKELLTELVDVFPESFVHLGGDEVPFDCWLSNPELWNYMTAKNLTPEQLENEYMQKIISTTIKLNATPVVWQEVFDNKVQLPQNTIVHVWKDWIDYRSEMADITRAGYQAIFSSCWYLDHLNSGGDWQKFYSCDPLDFPGTSEAQRLVLGGEACMWAEVVDATNVLTRVWPRSCAAAEKLWSSAPADIEEAARRLEEHACRMNMRGVPTQPPNGPGFCPFQLYV